MKGSRGKSTTAWSIALGVILILCGAFILRKDIIDQWYIWKLSDEDQAVRWEAALRLGERKVGRAAPRLMAALRREVTAPRSGSAARPPTGGSPYARALISIGAPAVPALAAGVEDRSVEVRSFAATLLGQFRDRPDVAVPALIRALEFEDQETLLAVLPALSAYGRQARVAVPRLIKLLGSRQSEEWLWVAGAIWSIDRRHPALRSALEKGLEDGDPLVREVAGQYLREIGGKTKESGTRKP